MALSLSSVRVSSLRTSGAGSSQRQYVRPCPPPKGLGDTFRDFIKIFSKPESTVDSWEGTGSTGFQGKISHHGPGKPFKDGFVNKMPASATSAQASASAAEGGQNDAASYMGEALERVVAHNFTGDENEPPTNTGAAGWQGDIHDRKKDGFHARKL